MPLDQDTADFFTPPEEQPTLFQFGVADDKWIKPLPEPAAEPLYLPNERT